MARERNEARLMEALMSKQPDPFAAILAWEDDRPFPRDFRLAAECSKRAGVLAMMADMRCDEAMRTQAFAALLRAMVLSDGRVGAMGHTLQALRLPEAFFHVTEDFAFTGEMCLCRLDPAVFIALACGVYISNNYDGAVRANGRRVCHELLAHLDAGGVDLSALDAAAAADGGSVEGPFAGATARDVRFAVAASRSTGGSTGRPRATAAARPARGRRRPPSSSTPSRRSRGARSISTATTRGATGTSAGSRRSASSRGARTATPRPRTTSSPRWSARTRGATTSSPRRRASSTRGA